MISTPRVPDGKDPEQLYAFCVEVSKALKEITEEMTKMKEQTKKDIISSDSSPVIIPKEQWGNVGALVGAFAMNDYGVKKEFGQEYTVAFDFFGRGGSFVVTIGPYTMLNYTIPSAEKGKEHRSVSFKIDSADTKGIRHPEKGPIAFIFAGRWDENASAVVPGVTGGTVENICIVTSKKNHK